MGRDKRDLIFRLKLSRHVSCPLTDYSQLRLRVWGKGVGGHTAFACADAYKTLARRLATPW
eukprot:5771669-Pleurochrysis_carterae.AAC.1